VGVGDTVRDDVAWGCAFIGWALTESGIKPPADAALCASFLKYGSKLAGPKVGALGVVGKEGIPEANTGLVGIVASVEPSAVTMIVGNVDNSVTRATCPLERLQAFIWPP